MLLGQRPHRLDLYHWQLEALVAWLRCGRRGVIEAVTGSGKTDVALVAVADALDRGRFVLILVPSRVLMEQWLGRLQAALPSARIGRLGDTGRDQPEDCDILIATRHSAAAYKPVPPGEAGGLLVADECHGLGGGVLRKALLPQYEERLGLTATLERGDDAVTDLLLPFFGGICYRYGFGEAIADGVCARPRVALVGVPLSAEERAEYQATEQQLVDARSQLRRIPGMPVDPFGAFLAAVAHLADNDAGPEGRAARDYLDAFGKRRAIVAQSTGKYELLGRFANLIRGAEGAVLFTETVRAANHAINRLDPLVSIDLITGATARRHRKLILDDLRTRRLDAVAAPRVLDEGIDVPDANLGIVMSASRTRRQMIQRMGRILRRKRPGVSARFVIMFAQDTLEDPASRIERDGFLDEIERIAESVGVYRAAEFDQLEEALSQPGPATVPEPARLERYDHLVCDLARAAEAASTAGATGTGGSGSTSSTGSGDNAAEAVAELVERLGDETTYAYLRFARPDRFPALSAAAASIDERLPRHHGDPEKPEPLEVRYLDPELTPVPDVTQPKVAPKRLSTGEAPLAIETVGPGWRLACTGCGASSATVKFRWQALEQTVECRCR